MVAAVRSVLQIIERSWVRISPEGGSYQDSPGRVAFLIFYYKVFFACIKTLAVLQLEESYDEKIKITIVN